MNHYEHESNNTAGDFRERHRPAWALIGLKEAFNHLTDGTWPPEPVNREVLTCHLVRRAQGPGTRDAVAALIDEAIEDDVLEERDGGERVVLHVEQRELVEIDIDDESTMTVVYYMTPKL